MPFVLKFVQGSSW